MKNINSYIHIPFCRSKCKYCRFASFSWLQNFEIKKYIKHLTEEINNIDLINYALDTIYFWWWTPSILDIEDLEQIIFSLKNKFNLNRDIEINIEANPGDITNENLIAWKKLWINRISIWIQTLNEDSLKEIWREHKWEILDSLNIIKKFSFKDDFAISLDFIIWLPYVKPWEIKEDIKFILEKYDFIKHISVYLLEEYYDIPEEKSWKFDNIIYPKSWNNLWLKEKDYLKEYTEVKNFLKQKWFNRYEISNYAKPWYESKHNSWYWKHKEYIWLGAWSHSFLNNTRFSNSETLKDYYEQEKISEKLSEEDLFLEKIIFAMRTNWLDKNIIKLVNQNELSSLILDWYLENREEYIVLTDKWVLLIDYILWKLVSD